MENSSDDMELPKNLVDSTNAQDRPQALAEFFDAASGDPLKPQGEGSANKEAPQSKEGRIDWAGLKCDNCSNLASHVSVDEETIGDDLVIHTAYCDDCYAVKVVGTVSCEHQTGDGLSPDYLVAAGHRLAAALH